MFTRLLTILTSNKSQKLTIKIPNVTTSSVVVLWAVLWFTFTLEITTWSHVSSDNKENRVWVSILLSFSYKPTKYKQELALRSLDLLKLVVDETKQKKLKLM